MKKKTVLMVHNFYQQRGGEDTEYHNEVRMLREHGHKVIEYTRNNAEIESHFITRLLLPFTTMWSFKTYSEICRIIKSEDIDIVHAHNTFPLISPSIYYAAGKMGKPVIQTVHNYRLICPAGVPYRDHHFCDECMKQNSYHNALKHKCYRNSYVQTLVVVLMLSIHRKIGTYKDISYIFLSKRMADEFSVIYSSRENIFIKPNFEDIGDSIDAGTHMTDMNKYIFAGRLEEYKGIISLMEMWKKLSEKYVLHIFGNGICRDSVTECANNCNNIVYHGEVTKEELTEQIEDACATIISSEVPETFGMLIAESFSRGVPVIATDIGNPAEMIVVSGAGELYQMQDPESFTDAIGRIAEDRKVYSEKARNYYRQHLCEEANYDTLSGIYDQLQPE